MGLEIVRDFSGMKPPIIDLAVNRLARNAAGVAISDHNQTIKLVSKTLAQTTMFLLGETNPSIKIEEMARDMFPNSRQGRMEIEDHMDF